jgi:hypothetical protein
VLQCVIQGRITFTPSGDGYVFEAATWYDKLFAGVAAPRPGLVAEGELRGTAHLGPEDAGRALRAAAGQGSRGREFRA